jgi:small-conductance mechanosensitive channel
MGDVNIKPTLPSEHHAAPTVHEVNVGAEASPEASAPVHIEAPAAPAVKVEQVQPAEPVEQVQPQPSWGGLFAILLIATLVSGVLVRLGRMQVLVQVRRWAPLAHLFVWALAILAGARVALSTFPTQWLIFMGLALMMLGAAGMSAMRSALAGLGIALEGRLSIGDTVQIGQLQGEIVAFGLRAARLRSPNGMTHDIPNERFMSEAVSTLGGAGGEAVCEVTVSIPGAIPVEAALELAREGAVLSPLSSPRHRPEVFLDVRRAGAPSVIRIRGYAFDPDYHDHFRSDIIRRVGHAVTAYQRQHEGVPIVLGDEPSSPLLT